MSTDRTKLVYLAPLEAGIDHPTFRERWRGHGELAMSLPQWEYVDRYELNPTLLDDGAEGARSTAGFGGIGILWIGDMPKFSAALEAGAGAILYKDELRVFGGLLGDNLQSTREEVVFDTGEPAFKLVVALWRASGMSRDEFSRLWSASSAPSSEDESNGRACRVVLNHTLNDDPEVVDGFLELGFETRANLLAHLRDPAAVESGEFVDQARSVAVAVSVNTVFKAT
jgi:hypothetical protein